jgi:uroporphyrinogen decarboxylase
MDTDNTPLSPFRERVFQALEFKQPDLCLVGGISTQKTLPFGTPLDVIREVDLCLEKMAEGGGYIMAPAQPILPGVPLENAVALIDSFVHQKN